MPYKDRDSKGRFVKGHSFIGEGAPKGSHRSTETEFKNGHGYIGGGVEKGRHLSPATEFKVGEHCGKENNLYIDGRSKTIKISGQYRGEDWIKARNQALEDADYKCFFSELSSCKGKIDVHHIERYYDTHNNSQENLIVLCRHHHKLFENGWIRKEGGGGI